MRKGTVLSLKNLMLTEFIFKNNILVLMALLFILVDGAVVNSSLIILNTIKQETIIFNSLYIIL